MSDDLKDTALFKRLRAISSTPDPLVDKVQAQVAFDETLSQLGIRAPAPEPHESDSAYLARLGEHAAAFGPEDRKHINRYALPPAALTEIVRQDLAIATAETHTPHYSLKPGELRQVIKEDSSGRPIYEFYSDEATGMKPWMNQFKSPNMTYVSGGSRGIATNEKEIPKTHSFMQSQTIPELIELRRREAYKDSPEARIVKAYRDAGEPEERLGAVLQQLRRG